MTSLKQRILYSHAIQPPRADKKLKMEKIVNGFQLKYLRYTLYLVTPNETTFEAIEDVPNYLDQTMVWLFAMVFLEILLLKGKHYSLNDSLTNLNAGLLYVLFKFGGRSISALAYPIFFNKFHVVDLSALSPWTWVLCFLTQDLAYYLAHRALHEIGFFWSFHQMHHSSEHYNLTISFRHGVIQDLFTAVFELMQALVIPPPVFLVHRYLCTIHMFWLHSRIIPYLGPLEYVLNTPSSHRVHHGRNRYCIDKNYGGTLIIWDRLFGTFAEERTDEEIAYGIVSPVKSFNVLWINFFEFKIFGYDKPMMKNEKGEDFFVGFWEKFKAVFYPPGYYPGSKTRLFFFWRYMEDPTEGIPDPEKPIQSYNPPLDLGIKIYLLIQSAIIAPTVIDFSVKNSHFGWIKFFVILCFIILRLQMFGFYFDRRPWATVFDITVMAISGIYACWTNNFYLSAYTSISIIVALWLNPNGFCRKLKPS